MTKKKVLQQIEDTPHDMMKRVFAVAELIVQSDSYHKVTSASYQCGKKHKSEDVLYCVDQENHSGSIDGATETENHS